MNTNMTGFSWFSKSLHPCDLDDSRLSIGRSKSLDPEPEGRDGAIALYGSNVCHTADKLSRK